MADKVSIQSQLEIPPLNKDSGVSDLTVISPDTSHDGLLGQVSRNPFFTAVCQLHATPRHPILIA